MQNNMSKNDLNATNTSAQMLDWADLYTLYQEPYEVALRDTPKHLWIGLEEPAPCKHDEVAIMVLTAGICGTDVRVYGGERVVPPGRIGHESVAMVIEVGETASKHGFKPGMIVTIDCNNPDNSRRDLHLDAALGRFYRVPADFVTAVPQQRLISIHDHFYSQKISPAHAAIVEPMTVALHAIDYLRQGRVVQREEYDLALQNQRRTHIPVINHLKSKNIVITGAGSIAVFAAMLARVSGAKNVIMLNRDTTRLQHAAEMAKPDFVFADTPDIGETLIDLSRSIGPIEYVLVASHMSAVEKAFSYLHPGGTVIMVAGIPKDGLLKTDTGEVALYPIRHDDLHREIKVNGHTYQLMGAHGTNEPLFREVLEYMANGVFEQFKIDPTEQVTHIVSLGSLPSVFELLHAKKPLCGELMGKVLIDFRLTGQQQYTKKQYLDRFGEKAQELFSHRGFSQVKNWHKK